MWQALALVVLFMAPGELALGRAPWALDRLHLVQVGGLAVVHGLLTAFLILGFRRRESPGPGLVLVLAAASVAPYLVALLIALPGYSRSIVAMGTGLFLLLNMVPFLLGRVRPALVYSLGVACLVLAGKWVVDLRRVDPEPVMASGWLSSDTRVIHSAFHTLRLTSFRLSSHHTGGGGIDRVGEDYLLVTGDGAFYRLRFEEDRLHATPMSLRAPFNRLEFLAAATRPLNPARFRVAGLLTQPQGDGARVVISHHYWNEDENCIVMRFSETVLADLDVGEQEVGADGWSTLFETRPCLPLKDRGQPLGGHQSGGRIAPLGDTALLVTVGDHEFDGLNTEVILPQSTDNDYGKTLLLSGAGGELEIFSLGHRNPQGLLVERSGEIWLTEHGPQGGDKLIRLVKGGNYGWPFHTHGADYGDVVWPLQDPSALGTALQEAAFTWIPAIGPSNLITVEAGLFPRWQGDLLVSSLRARSLFRIRRDEGRIVYVEPIPVEWRIRDLAEGADGRIVLWSSESRTVASLTPAEVLDGEALFQPCLRCHSIVRGEHGVGPSLANVLGARVAAQPNFNYSGALRDLDGTWTEERLDHFLADPEAFAPGTTMVVPGIDADRRRQAIIQYLRGLPD